MEKINTYVKNIWTISYFVIIFILSAVFDKKGIFSFSKVYRPRKVPKNKFVFKGI